MKNTLLFFAFLCVPFSARAVETFTFVLLPDTQRYANSATNMVHFHNQTQWIVDNRAAENIVFASHVGDIVENNDQIPEQWVRVDAAMDRLDVLPDLPYGVVLGNHDYDTNWNDPNNTATAYLANFGPERYAGRSWYLGHSPDQRSHYQRFYAAGRNYLHISLEWRAASANNANRNEVIAWAQGVLDAYPNTPTIITTHSYLGNNNARLAEGNDIFNSLVRSNSQVFLVLGGHAFFHGHATAQNDEGGDVFEILSNFQGGYPEGGSGYLTLLTFDEDNDVINVRTYSPSLDSYLTSTVVNEGTPQEVVYDLDYSFPMNFDARLGAGGLPAPIWLDDPAAAAVRFDGADLEVDISQDASDVRVLWDSSDQGTGDPADWANSLVLPAWTGGNGQLTATLPGLSENTSYTFRIYASDPVTSSEGWSPAVTFTTLYENPPPLMGTPVAVPHLISQTEATLECQLNQGAADVTLVWALTDQGESSIAAWTGAPGGGSHAFPSAAVGEVLSHAVTGLSNDTDYAFRFYATNAFGTDWSEAGSFTTQPPPNLSSGLVAYFPLDETSGTVAPDAFGGNDGVLRGNFTGSEWTTGKVGVGALQFTRTGQSGVYPNGTHAGFIEADELLKTVNPSSGVLEDGSSYTFNAWVKWVPASSGGVGFGYAIWGANTEVGDNGNVIRLGLDNNADGFMARALNGLAVDGSGVVADFTDGLWHMVTVFFEPGGNADIYFDGQLSVSKTSDPADEREEHWSAANLFHFGMEMEAGLTTDPFSGTLDELAIWNRELTLAELTVLYNQGNGVSLGGTPPPTGPVLGPPSSSNETDDGATLQCQLLRDDADEVTLVWAWADQGETTVGAWAGAAGGGAYSFGAAVEDDVLSRTVSGLNGDRRYYFRFIATKAPDEDWSSAGTFATGLGGSPAPADFSGTAGTEGVSTKVDLSWSDHHLHETGFLIRRSTDPAFGTFDEFLVGANETTFTDDTTSPSTTYYYRIAAVGTSGEGAFSVDLEVTTGNNPGGSGTLSQGLVAYFPLNETSGTRAAEMVAGNDGTLSGNFTGAEWTPGRIGGGLAFTRTATSGSYPGTHAGFIEADELLKTANPATGVLEDGVVYTFNAWVRWAPWGGSPSFGYAIWGANTNVSQNGNVIRLGLDNGADGFTARAVNGLAAYAGGVAADFTDGEWHMVTAVFEVGGNADLYFDGQLSVSTTSDTGNEREKLWSQANLFHFGMEMEANQTTDPFSGTLDELAMWNRALTPSEIATLYNGGLGISPLGPPPAPVLAIDGDETSITLTWDSMAGMVYTLRSSETMATAPSLWPVHLTYAGMEATPPLNTLMISRPAASRMFFVVEETPAP